MAKFLNCIKIRASLWRARLTFPFDPELGYKPSAKDFYGKTAAEADKNRREWKPENKSVDREMTLLDFVKDHFIADQEAMVKAGNISWAYVERRTMILRKYFLEPDDKRLKESPLRKVALGNLKPQHMEAYFKCVALTNISQEYHHRLKTDMRAVLKLAKHKIPESVVDYFKDIEVPPLPKRQNMLVLFDPQEIYSRIVDESLPVEDRALIGFPFILNRRPSEAFALQWTDLDLDAGTIHIHKAMKRILGGSFKIGKLKTEDKAIRVLPLGEELKSLFARLQQQRIQQGIENQFVFLTKTDRVPYNTQNFKKNWKKIKKVLRLPDGPTYYSLKHLGNSYALANGVSVEAQAWKMGHSDTTMAQSVYREIMGAEKIKTVSIYSQLAPAKKEL